MLIEPVRLDVFEISEMHVPAFDSEPDAQSWHDRWPELDGVGLHDVDILDPGRAERPSRWFDSAYMTPRRASSSRGCAISARLAAYSGVSIRMPLSRMPRVVRL